jgi:hypothetical protein
MIDLKDFRQITNLLERKTLMVGKALREGND